MFPDRLKEVLDGGQSPISPNDSLSKAAKASLLKVKKFLSQGIKSNI